ncbi:hypothetical protein LSS_23125 [Leptospira santarosai serovar Shermani str. LT 821]|uniref:Uncharacterized protein n=1 Tax=Leptospira santarosai serovar Shermani str. LT 821 TaxID=758847 RepID=A0A097ET12_9LEPT|nr:hypothetical protein LSS_23125 [Leptospira santarosai serovar Shermani str. LT 821]
MSIGNVRVIFDNLLTLKNKRIRSADDSEKKRICRLAFISLYFIFCRDYTFNRFIFDIQKNER